MIFNLFILASMGMAQMQLGFLPEDSAHIPQSVQQVQNKIFQISVPYFEKWDRAKALAALWDSRTSENDRKALEQFLSSKRKSIWNPIGSIQGTAFVGKDPSILWTNCHMVSSWMRSASQGLTFKGDSDTTDFFRSHPIPLEVQDPVTGTFFTELTSNLEVFAPLEHGKYEGGDCDSFKNDVVRIQLSRPISSSGLEWASGRDFDEQTLYLGGFPRPTSSRAALGFQDSDGNSFRWTRGPYVNTLSPGALDFWADNAKLRGSLKLQGPYSKYVFADSVEGMSGAPVLNSKGQLVGIFRSFLPGTNTEIPEVSIFVSTQGMRYLELRWGP